MPEAQRRQAGLLLQLAEGGLPGGLAGFNSAVDGLPGSAQADADDALQQQELDAVLGAAKRVDVDDVGDDLRHRRHCSEFAGRRSYNLAAGNPDSTGHGGAGDQHRDRVPFVGCAGEGC